MTRARSAAAILVAVWMTAAQPYAQTVIKLPKNKFTPQQDVQIGKEGADEVRKQYPVITDEHIQKYLTGLGDRLVAAAPAMGSTKGTSGSLSQLTGQAGGLMAAASAFSKLGLSPDLVAKAVPILTSFVGKSGGANVASLLAGVLK